MDGVLDIGCGRGGIARGFMKEAGIRARGIDLSDESIVLCRAKALEAEKAESFRVPPRPA